MDKIDLFQRFGRLRNMIVHFAIPNRDLRCEIFSFAVGVMEPLIQRSPRVRVPEAAARASRSHVRA